MFSQQQSACTQRLQGAPSFFPPYAWGMPKGPCLAKFAHAKSRTFPASDRSCKSPASEVGRVSPCPCATSLPKEALHGPGNLKPSGGDHHCAFWMDHPPDWLLTPLFRTRCSNRLRLQTPTVSKVGRPPTSTLTCSESELTRPLHYRNTRSHGGS